MQRRDSVLQSNRLGMEEYIRAYSKTLQIQAMCVYIPCAEKAVILVLCIRF